MAPNRADICAVLRSEILDGKYDGGVRFPSEPALARRFGVSRSTVTRVLDRFKQEGLLVSRKGSGSKVRFDKLGGSRQIGFLVPGPESNEFYSGIVRGAIAKCHELGYEPMLRRIVAEDGKMRQRREAAHVARDFVANHADGVLFFPFSPADGCDVNAIFLSALVRKCITVQLVNRTVDCPETANCDLVCIDNVAAGRRIARYLIGKGVRRCLFVNHMRLWIESVNLRHIGMSAEFANVRGSEFRLVKGRVDDLRTVRGWFRRYRPQAIACETDVAARLLLRTLSAADIKVPDDVLVTGFDGLQPESNMPTLTTVRQPLADIGSVAIARLLERIRKPSLPRCDIMLDAAFEIGETTE